MTDSDVPALYRLRSLFDDRPDLLEIVTLADAESHEMAGALRTTGGLFADSLNTWATGRTGAGKSSLGNSLCGSAAMPSDGHTNCTFEIGVLRMPSNLSFIDTPGGGDKELFENVTRIALALPLLPVDVPDKVTLRDYTPMLVTGGTYTDEAVPAADWPTRAAQLAPDVVVFFVAPHHQFVRADRDYLREMYRAFGDKVVVALNLFRRDGRELYTPQNLADAREGVAEVHAQVFPAAQDGPRTVEINALTGAGLDELTAAVCAVVPPQKIGRLESVLRAELKPRARRERDRQFRHTLHW
ncbi:MAG: GTPase, partial [Pseudonocardiaceae bacterium]